MRKIDHPAVDDASVLANLSVSAGETARSIVGYMERMSQRYSEYSVAGGDPWVVDQCSDCIPIGNQLRGLFDSPTVDLAYIDEIRAGLGGACPVCGRDALGTLDHYLPKQTFPEFSFYSKNLVPACDRCNNQRGTTLKGLVVGERPIHPYFDGFVASRVMTVTFRPNWQMPTILPVPFGVRGLKRRSVQWHIDNIIKPARIFRFLDDLWLQVVRQPGVFVGSDPSSPLMKAKLFEYERLDAAATSSQNSWRSSFFHGLQRSPGALRFLGALL